MRTVRTTTRSAATATTTHITKLQEIRASKRTTTRIAATATTTNITKLQEIRESTRTK